jgi:hypothetical protein
MQLTQGMPSENELTIPMIEKLSNFLIPQAILAKRKTQDLNLVISEFVI